MKRYPLTYNPILDYFEKIQTGEIVVGKKVSTVYKKLVADIYRTEDDYEYSGACANHVIEFCENFCRQSKGTWGGEHLKLELWQKALLAAAFGFIHKKTKFRKYREVLLVVGRKNGKSTLASAIGLYLLVGDGEPGPEVYAVATKKDQAKIIWGEAKKMVQKSPMLYKSKRNPSGIIKPRVADLISEFNDGVFEPLGRDSDTLDGLNVHGATLDELHAWTDQNLYDVVKDGCSAREQPMIFILTTQGFVRENVMDHKYEHATAVLNGYEDDSPTAYRDTHFLPIIYELDSKEEWQEEDKHAKANPGLGTIKNKEILTAKVAQAKQNPRLVRNLLCKDFNIPQTAVEAWLSYEELNNETLFDVEKLKPRYGIGGADLSSTTDLTAAKVIFMVPEDPNIYVLQQYWMPEEVVERRIAEDNAAYGIWIDMGFMKTCAGNKINYTDVTNWFVDVQEKLDIYLPWIGYDRWESTYWVDEMEGYFGKNAMIEVIQGAKTLSRPMKLLRADLDAKKIIYNNHPVDKWCFGNTSIHTDSNGNIKPQKPSNQRHRIDGTAALLNSYVVLQDKMTEYLTMI